MLLRTLGSPVIGNESQCGSPRQLRRLAGSNVEVEETEFASNGSIQSEDALVYLITRL